MDNFQIETSQNVGINQNVASITDRMIGFLIDTLIIVVYFMVVIWVLVSTELTDYSDLWTFWLIVGLPPFLYYLLFETFMNGRTPGKVVAKTRVVKLDGSHPTFVSFFMRWILRILDVSLTSCGMAVVSILLSDKGQRIGDRAAGTTVISEKKRVSIRSTLVAEVDVTYVPTYPQVSVLTDADVTEIRNIYREAKIKGNHGVVIALSDQVKKILDVTPKENPIEFIEVVLKDYVHYTSEL